MSKTVDCPYCGYENDVYEYLSDARDNKFDCECESCEKDFEVEVEYEPSFSSCEIVYEDCQSCGKETREPYKKGRIFPYPSHIDHDMICQACWHSAYLEELEMKAND
ncbi:hypothetical protein EBB07_28760 [Paenibacillaceae bacterium]|nr:hypothetical protein EBB07_28760 [Paenibacillaceae bacterium]